MSGDKNKLDMSGDRNKKLDMSGDKNEKLDHVAGMCDLKENFIRQQAQNQGDDARDDPS